MFPADDAPTARCSQRIRPTRTDGTRDELAGLTCYFDFTKPQAVLLHQNSSETRQPGLADRELFLKIQEIIEC